MLEAAVDFAEVALADREAVTAAPWAAPGLEDG